MTLISPSPSVAVIIAIIFIIISVISSPALVYTLGSGSTIAVSYGSATICGIVAGETFQRIECYRQGSTISVLPNVSFESISGGMSFFCGLKSGGFSIHCWDTGYSNTSFKSKRIYHSDTVGLTDLTVGDVHVCAVEINTGVGRCWRGSKRDGSPVLSPNLGLKFRTITSGRESFCGILTNNNRVLCWGDSLTGAEIQKLFDNVSMSSLVAGESHACGLTTKGMLICKGKNDFGQLNAPLNSLPYEYSTLSLSANHSCAIRRRNGLVECWGEGMKGLTQMKSVSFESIVSGLDFTCGLTTRNLSIICWGPGWSSDPLVPLTMIVPGPCVGGSCTICGMYPNSVTLCNGNGNICKPCQNELPLAVPLVPILPSPPQQSINPPSIVKNRLFLAFAVIGSIGGFAGICTIFYCIWTGVFGFWHKKIHSTGANVDTMMTYNSCVSLNATPPRPSIKQQSSWRLRRQRSGTSSTTSSKQGDKAEKFSLSELAFATNNFSLENKIGGGSFGIVYKGKLADGREVAIKKGEISRKIKKFQEKECAFDSELALLSRLHHKHLVELVGFCQEKNERLLVYEYMSNGALHDHLHTNINNVEISSSIMNSWKMRIKIALDAARGIEYLHNYAVPPIIHRDIKSSNILLDFNWTARVSDLGLSLIGPEDDQESMSTKAVGTVGYIDPEYYVLNVLTAKSDVYGLGVVLLELLTGKRAIFKNEEDGAGPMGVVEYAGPRISAGELWRVLDTRAGLPENVNEAEALELLAYTATTCVNLEGKDRPTMSEVVANLERAKGLCDQGSHASTSTSIFSLPSQ